MSHVQAGQLRALAVFDSHRSSVLAEVPTSHELGYRIGAPAWSGFFGPAGMPDERIELLADAFKTAFGSDEWADLCRERGMEALYLDRTGFRQFAQWPSKSFSRARFRNSCGWKVLE